MFPKKMPSIINMFSLKKYTHNSVNVVKERRLCEKKDS